MAGKKTKPRLVLCVHSPSTERVCVKQTWTGEITLVFATIRSLAGGSSVATNNWSWADQLKATCFSKLVCITRLENVA